MKDTQENLAIDSIPIEETINEVGPEMQQEPVDSQEPELSELDKLINRRTGYFGIKLDLADLKWIKNACNAKFTFTGPNEAFMLLNCYLGFSSAIARIENDIKNKVVGPELINVQASALEAAAILLNKYSGTGTELADRVFKIAIALNSPVMEMKSLDKQIEFLRSISDGQPSIEFQPEDVNI